MRMHQRLPAPPPWLRPPPKELLRERLGDGRLTEGRLLPKEPEGFMTPAQSLTLKYQKNTVSVRQSVTLSASAVS